MTSPAFLVEPARGCPYCEGLRLRWTLRTSRVPVAVPCICQLVTRPLRVTRANARGMLVPLQSVVLFEGAAGAVVTVELRLEPPCEWAERLLSDCVSLTAESRGVVSPVAFELGPLGIIGRVVSLPGPGSWRVVARVEGIDLEAPSGFTFYGATVSVVAAVLLDEMEE